MARCWYAYNGIGDPLLIASYTLITIGKPVCISGSFVCAIYAPACGPNPSVLSTRIKSYIGFLLSTLVPQPGDEGVKKYVYGKN